MPDALTRAAPSAVAALAVRGVTTLHLTICVPLVFLIGAPTLLVTRMVFQHHYPHKFVGTLPSISGTAAAAPASSIFMWAILAVVLCILVSWSLELAMVRQRLTLAAPHAQLAQARRLNVIACVTGMLAGVFLGLLAVVNLQTGNRQHMLFSVLFFVCQAVAFLFDTWCATLQRRLLSDLDGPAERLSIAGKLLVAGATVVSAFFFLFMFIAKDRNVFADRYTAQVVYVTAEYLLAMLLFAYPVPAYFEVRRHYRERALPTLAADRGRG
jgi:hypothetical protein